MLAPCPCYRWDFILVTTLDDIMSHQHSTSSIFIRWEPYLPCLFSDVSLVDIICQLSAIQILVNVFAGGQHAFILVSETHWWHQVITLQLLCINLSSVFRHLMYIPTNSPSLFFISPILLLSSLSTWQTHHLNSSLILHYPGSTPCMSGVYFWSHTLEASSSSTCTTNFWHMSSCAQREHTLSTYHQAYDNVFIRWESC